nr:unnamed protein product [Callosobruchus chinensis]
MEDLDFQIELSKLLYTDSTTLKRIHIDESCSSESEPDGRVLDEEYMKNQPPPCDYNIIKDLVVKIGTESIGTKKKKKKKKKKTNQLSECAITQLSVESGVSSLLQANDIPECDINPFNALLNINDDNPADIANLCSLDRYSDIETEGKAHCEDVSTNFAFDFVSEVDPSWETALNKKSKKLRKIKINENTEESPSLVLETLITKNTTSASNGESLPLTYCSNDNSDLYFSPEIVPDYSDTVIRTTSSEIHGKTIGCKKKTKKRKKAGKKTSQMSESTYSIDIPAANAAYMSDILENSPNPCHGIKGSGSVIRESNNRFQDRETSDKVDGLIENTYRLEGVEKSLELFDSVQKMEHGNYLNTENMLYDRFYNDFPNNDARNTKFEPAIFLYDTSLPTEKNKKLPKYNDESVCLKSQCAGLKSMKNGGACKKDALKHLSTSDYSNADHIEVALSQQQSTVESENIIWDWELYNNREIHEATPNKVDLFGIDESIHYDALSNGDNTSIGKSYQIIKTDHFQGKTQYPMEASYLFEHEAFRGDGVQMKAKLENSIPLTPNEIIDTSCLPENNVKSYTTCTKMQPEKTESTKKKGRTRKKKCNSRDPQQLITAAKLAKSSPWVDNIIGASTTSSSDYIDFDSIPSACYKSEAYNEVYDFFEDVHVLDSGSSAIEWVVKSYDSDNHKQLQQIKKIKKRSKKKLPKELPIKESVVPDVCIFNESDFPPLFPSNISTEKKSTSMNINNITCSATLPEPAPWNLFYSAKNKHIEKKQSIGGSDVSASKICESDYPFKPHNNDSLPKHDTGNLETEIIRFFQSNIPYDFTANIFPTTLHYVDVFGRDNTKKYVDKNVSKIYEQISYSGSYDSQPDLFKNASKKNSTTPVRSDCAQNMLLCAIAKPVSNVHVSGMNAKLSNLSKILASHTEIIKCHDNISNLNIMIPANLFQYIQKDQKCQSNILEFLIAGSGLQQQTSLFFYNEIYEKSASISESMYLGETLQKGLTPVTKENSEFSQESYHSLEGVALSATAINSENLDTSCVKVKCQHVLSREIDDGTMKNVVIDTNTCFAVISNNVQHTANSSNPFHLRNDISHLSADNIPSLLEDCGMTDERKLSDLLDILAMNTEIMKIQDNISHISVMIPANLSKQIQKDQKCQNLILEFLTAGVATLSDQMSLFFYDIIDEKGAVGDDNLANYFYLGGKLYKKTGYDYNVYNPSTSNSIRVIETYNANIERPTNSMSCSLNNVSTGATGYIENLNDSCTNTKCVLSENNISSAPCDNILQEPHSGIVKTSSSYPTIIVENVVNLSLYCLYHLINDII